MTMHLFVSSELIRNPDERQAKNGNSYTVALLCDGDQVISVTTFDSDLAGQLLGLAKGDPVAVAGRLQVGIYTDKAGETRVSPSVTATQLMAIPAMAAEAKPRARRKPSVPSRRERSGVPSEFELDDPIPF